jgi:LuxR family maltose regulon positive regulatory protein
MLTWMRGQIALGQGEAILPYLGKQLERASANGLTGRVIELSLLEAAASRAVGDEGRSRASLERGLALAEPAGYVRVFDQGPELTQLLTAYLPPETAERGVRRAYVERILNAITVPQSRGADRQPEPTTGATRAGLLETGERLSERELEVLRLMAAGLSNADIAGQLVITIGTVKSHINHILGKLGARNRTEAVARARRQGLIDF